MTARKDEIKLDLEDLNSLLESATRQKSKDLLTLEIRKLQSELMNIQNPANNDQQPKVSRPASTAPKYYDIKLNNYAWDQTNEFVKLYVTLNNVQSLPKEAVFCNFFDRSIDLHVVGLDNKNYVLPINNLCEVIDAEKSYIKIKTDMIIIYLSKKLKKNWSHVTSVEKILKEAKSNALSNTMPDTDDVNGSIMNMMKKMYQEGDDEMKRTIAKAWCQSQDKKEKGLEDLPGF